MVSLSIEQRRDKLKAFHAVLLRNETAIAEALYEDFKKPKFESLLTETAIVLSELRHTIKHMRKWSAPKRVKPSILNFPSTDYIYRQPYGSVLIISPWNYPYQLAICPMIAAYAAGNAIVLKPSELTPNTSSLISRIVSEVFDPTEIEVFQGGAEVAQKLLERRWDYIFFTGSVRVGKVVAETAAQNLTPLTLELGGKNPCIVDKTANLELAAKRIVWGKFLNAGQTCIAPDFILVESVVKTRFLQLLKNEIESAYGSHPQSSPDFARIIDARYFDRLVSLIEDHKIVHGGQRNASELFISPTLIDEADWNSAIMQQEIFGPLLPVLAFESPDEIKTLLNRLEAPLAFYVFSADATFSRKLMDEQQFGGGCINDTVVHFANKRLPFGGFGQSGQGAYRGKFSFDTFSHAKAVVKKATWFDVPLRYAPYKDKYETLKSWFKWL